MCYDEHTLTIELSQSGDRVITQPIHISPPNPNPSLSACLAGLMLRCIYLAPGLQIGVVQNSSVELQSAGLAA